MTRWPLSEAKAPERPLFSRVLLHKTLFVLYFAFTADSLQEGRRPFDNEAPFIIC